eukprot:scaffold4916_cov28-Tisochrysis_lutea.AAC.6
MPVGEKVAPEVRGGGSRSYCCTEAGELKARGGAPPMKLPCSPSAPRHAPADRAWGATSSAWTSPSAARRSRHWCTLASASARWMHARSVFRSGSSAEHTWAMAAGVVAGSAVAAAVRPVAGWLAIATRTASTSAVVSGWMRKDPRGCRRREHQAHSPLSIRLSPSRLRSRALRGGRPAAPREWPARAAARCGTRARRAPRSVAPRRHWQHRPVHQG